MCNRMFNSTTVRISFIIIIIYMRCIITVNCEFIQKFLQ